MTMMVAKEVGGARVEPFQILSHDHAIETHSQIQVKEEKNRILENKGLQLVVCI